MLPNEIELLERIVSAGFLPDSEITESAALNGLRLQGYVESGKLLAGNRISDWVYGCVATPAGQRALQEAKELSKQQADRQADAARQIAAQEMKAEINADKQRRHDFKVAAFSVILTLCLEHFRDIVNLLKRALEAVGILPK